MRRPSLLFLLLLTSCAPGLTDHGDLPPSLELARAKNYVFARSSSRDPKGGNMDMRPIEPGAELVLADLEGPGVITHLWFTIAHREEASLRKLVLKAFWEGSAEPSILSPVGDFFGIGHGGDKRVFFDNAYFDVSPQLGLNCYLPMPFRERARLTVTNEGEERVGAFYFYVDWTRVRGLPEDALSLVASYRQAFPAKLGEDFTFAEGRGRGHLLGVNLSVETTRNGWWGEGDDHIVIDGVPVMEGTGTEDYFCGAWNFRAAHHATWSGSPRLEEELRERRHSVYRFHGTDPIPFRESFSYRCEHGHANDRPDNWASVAFWYQTLPHDPLPALPPAEERVPGKMPPIHVEAVPEGGFVLEGEALVTAAKATSGALSAQDLDQYGNHWSRGAQLWWRPEASGAELRVPFAVTPGARGRYRVTALLTCARDYAAAELSVDGAAPVPIDASSERVGRMAPLSLGEHDLAAGEHVLTVRVTGKNARSVGFMFGLDCLVLARIP